MNERIITVKSNDGIEYYFDKELLASNTDSLRVAIMIACKTFPEWFDKEFSRTRLGQHLCAIWTPEYFDLWFDPEKYDFNLDTDVLMTYCSDHKEKWKKYIKQPEKIIENNGHKYQLIEDQLPANVRR